MEGEGTTAILAFVGGLVLLLAAVVAWQLIKKKRSVYTYAYGKK